MTIKNLHKHVHFIGIGGISMSAIAHILLQNGFKVSGSDASESPIIAKLASAGANIVIGHSAGNIEDADLVVYTAAIAEDNPELTGARARGIPTLERADFLGELMRDYDMPIAVSGTHGKTTTTAMLSCVLLNAGLNPTVLVGGELSQINGNYHLGTAKHLVFEACEYVDSFLKFHPFAAIVLNVEADHLDYFSGIGQIKDSFNRFLKKIPEGGFAVLNADDPNVMESAAGIACQKVLYGENGQYRAEHIRFDEDGNGRFTVCYDGGETQLRLAVKGSHNVSNALAVFAAAHRLGVDPQAIAKGIVEFEGTKRRFEYKGSIRNARLYDDYAHHPTEISATIDSAKKMPHGKLWCIFQPHTYSRTKALMNEFAAALSQADRVIITDIYAAREKSDGVTHAIQLAERIPNAKYISGFDEIAEYINGNVGENDIVITMGAGTVTNLSERLL